MIAVNKLITNQLPKDLIDAYLNNSAFNALVHKHEMLGSKYETMLEDAVIILIKEVSERTAISIKYAERYGVLES